MAIALFHAYKVSNYTEIKKAAHPKIAAFFYNIETN